MRFSDAFLRTLRERVSIADYAGRRLAWDKRKSQPARGDFWACCPFHTEKTPSFHVLDAKGIYKCFGCGAAGDVFTLAMQLTGGSFPEAVAQVAAFAGVALPEDDREEKETSDRRKRLLAALARATALYAEALRSGEGRHARAYLEGRGFTPELCRQFGIGYAPDGWTWTIDRLKSEFPLDELIEAGLARPPGEDRRAIDTFRGRITFEIADTSGRVIAFGGRALNPEASAKYINSPETPLFSKGRTLYRLKQARELLAKTKSTGLVVVEGYFDAIAFERAGVAAIAPLGTALTEDQLHLVWRAGGEPILCFDGDAAGRRAADRALDLALPHFGPGRTVRIALIPRGEDPDEVYRREGGGALQGLLSAAQPAVVALFERERTRRPLDTPEARADLKQRLRICAQKIADEETRRQYLADLLSRAFGACAPQGAGARERAFSRPSERLRGKGTPGPTPELKAQAARRRDAVLEELIRTAVDHPTLLDRGADALARLGSLDEELEKIKSAILSLWFHTQSVDRASLRLHLRRSGEARAAARVDAWPRPKISIEELEGDWMALATAESAAAANIGDTPTGARVAARGGVKAKAARPRPISAQNEAEWEAQMGAGLAASAVAAEARALAGRVDEDAEAMARAQELLRDRHRAQGAALRISQSVGAEPEDGAELDEA
jgi:DNA primase